MPDINRIYTEIQAWGQAHPGLNPIDGLRREKIDAVKRITNRPLVIYATDFLTPKALNPQVQAQLNIGLRDKDMFLDILKTVPGTELDLLIQSPGGSAEVTEGIVAILRGRFTHIRCIVPGMAKSAATMLALSGNQLVMDRFSELGPTDPQILVNGRFSPAGSILKQFTLAQDSLKADPSRMPVWLPVLQMYGPSLLVECRHHIDLSQSLVSSWLKDFMFAGRADADALATDIAAWLAEDDNFHTHGRRVSIDQLAGL